MSLDPAPPSPNLVKMHALWCGVPSTRACAGALGMRFGYGHVSRGLACPWVFFYACVRGTLSLAAVMPTVGLRAHVTEPPNYDGPHVPVIVIMNSDSRTYVPHNLKGLLSFEQDPITGVLQYYNSLFKIFNRVK
jgi:hypothetical protein